MTYRSLFAMPALLLALGIGGAALAAPAGSAKGIGLAEDNGLVHKTHGCHRSCERGPAGWHRHRGPFCARVACTPRAWYPNRCFVDRWGVRHCRW
jgi:hypothetical protein